MNIQTLTDRQIKANNMKLKQLREQLDALGKILDTPDITHERYNLVMDKMREVWEKIKEAKKIC